MTSAEAYKWIIENNPGKFYDFVHIDGDHSEQGIKIDLELYWSLLKEGGLLSMHDVGLVHPLTEIVKERFGDKLNQEDDFTAWVIKERN